MNGPIKLQWHDTDAELIEQYTDTVILDLQKFVHEDLDKISDLVFHLVFLTDDYDGPNVIVWGVEGDDAYHCEYAPTMGWSEHGTK